MQIAIFGGSFDPIHVAHVTIVQEALKNLDIDMLVIVPTYLNPFKSRFYLNPQTRFKLIQKVFSKFEKVQYGYTLINSKNPIYNMALIECKEKDKFLISDYREIKEKLFENPLSRGAEEKETLEEILSYFLNKENQTKSN